MAIRSLPLHEPLAASSRVAAAAARLRTAPLAEVVVLALLGTAAAVLTLKVDPGLRVPGHAILRCVFPLALGLALVPRRYAGSVMGTAALGALLLQGMEQGAPGWGSATSLVLTGPLLDLAVRRARSGRGVYVAFLAAGTAANLLAFGARLGAKLLLHDGGRPLAAWWPGAIVTYVLCGAAAGVVSAAVWFRAGAPAAGVSGTRAGR